jgi:type III restriction enzyme
MVEHTLEVEKRKTIKVKKVLKEILAVQKANAENIKIDFKKYKAEAYQSFVSEGGIFLGDDGEAIYKEARAVRKLEDKNDFTFYEIAEIINRYTHLSCVVIDSIISGSGKKRDVFVKMANDNFAVVPFVIQEILKSVYTYEEKTETVEEELELTKLFPFKINVQQGRNTLVVYKEGEAEDGRKGHLGFHINPYAFDSGDEKDLFRYLRDVLDKQETIKDVYFTGARVCSDPSRTDFYFEYWSPEQKRVGRYFPDFLIETSKERFIVIEAKGSNEKSDYDASKRKYNGKLETLTNEILAKEIGFNDFKNVNKNFEYKIIFDASLQREQVKLFEELKKK